MTTLRPGTGLRRYNASDISWGYRETSLPYDEIVLECELSTNEGEREADSHAHGDRRFRAVAQPSRLSLPSCGSVFRNPERESVGRLIENVGLKGASCGGAQISELHANFIVNRGGARAVEVLRPDSRRSKRGGERYGIELVPEVRFLGFA